MWNQILTDVKRLKQINAKAADISNQIVELEAAIAIVDPETGKGGSASFQQILVASELLHKLCPFQPSVGPSCKVIRFTHTSNSSSTFSTFLLFFCTLCWNYSIIYDKQLTLDGKNFIFASLNEKI